MTDPPLLTHRQDRLLTLTVNRPEQRNALSLALLDEIGATLDRHRDDPDLRCVVITATGDRCFAAGGDLKELDAIRSEAEALAMSRRGREALDAIRSFPVPVAAGLNGLALGGGAELAMACDLRVAAAEAEIGFLQAQLNVTTAWGGGIDLIAAAGLPRALDLLLTARRISAGEALALGIVNRVCATDESLQDCLAAFLRPYLQRSPGVARGFKSLLSQGRRALHAQLAATEQSGFVATWTHADHWEAVDEAARQRQQRKAGA